MMHVERYEMTTGSHYKFWEVTYPIDGNQPEREWIVRWGRIGTNGQIKQFHGSPGQCHGEARAKIREKLDKGYKHVSGHQSYAPPTNLPPPPPPAKLPIKVVLPTLPPAVKPLQDWTGGTGVGQGAPVLADIVARGGAKVCKECNGTGRFMRSFGRLDHCRPCKGTGEATSNIDAVAAPVLADNPLPTARKFDWSE
jgi:predicted DNA-binding WGR domain protein